MQVSGPVCLQIVAQGFFVDWQQQSQQAAQHGPQMLPQQIRMHPMQAMQPMQPPGQQVRTVPMPKPEPNLPGQITQSDIPQALGIRNPAFNVHPHNSGNQGG